MEPLAAGGGGDQWSAFDAFVPEAAAAAPPERSPSRVPESALKVTTQQNSAMLRLHEQTIGQLATNSVTALVDTVQEVNSLPRVTAGAVVSAVTRPDRAPYLGLVLVFLGIAVVLLDVEA